MRRLLLLPLFGLCATFTASGADTAAIRVNAFPPFSDKPVFVPAENGQGLVCDNSSYTKLPGSGFIRRDAGTVELKVRMRHDLKPYGDYRMLFTLPPDAAQKFSNQFGLIFTPTDSKLGFKEGGLVFTIKNGTTSNSVNAQGLDWKINTEHSIIATWGTSGMKLYLDGKLAGQNSYTGGFHSEEPAAINLGQGADFIVDELKISDLQRDAAYATTAAESGQAPQLDDHTLALMHFDGTLAVEGANTEWRASRSPILLINPRDFNISSATNNIFNTGENVFVDAALFVSRPGNTTPITLAATIKTFKGVEVARTKIQITPQTTIGLQNFTVPLPLKDKVGWYAVTLELIDGDKSLSGFTTPCLVIPPAPKSRYEFGLDYYGSSYVPWVSLKRLGMTWVRPHNNHWNWHVVELRKGEFDFSQTDADVAGANANGIKIMAVLGLAPEWAGTPPDNYEAFKGGANEWKVNSWKYNWRAKNLDDYRNYVTKIVERYKGKVEYWEHYNEPDWHLPQTVGFAYGGTTEQFVEQMKVNAEVIRKIDPKAKILFPGIACVPIADPNFVRDVLKLGGLQYFDIVGMHSYGGINFFAKQVELFRQAGYKGEIWQTEKLTSKNNLNGTGYEGMYLLQIPDIVETMAIDVPVYIAHPLFDYFKRGVPQIESFVVPFFYRMVGERTYAGHVPQSNIHFFDGKEGPMLVTWDKKPFKLKVGQDKVIVTSIFGESSEVETPGGILSLGSSEEPRYITSAPGKIIALAQVGLPAQTLEPLNNGDFEEVDGDAGLGVVLPRFWLASSYHNTGKFSSDSTIFKSGKYSMRLESPKTDKESVAQDVSFAVGHTYSITGWIRTESKDATSIGGTKAFISIWCRSLSKELTALRENNSSSREFHQYSATFTVPPEATDIAVSCCVMAGTDKAWFDAIEIKEVK